MIAPVPYGPQGGAGGGGLTPVFTNVVSGAVTTVIDTGANAIPQTGNILEIFLSGQISGAIVLGANTLTFNGDTAAHYDDIAVFTNTATVSTNANNAAANEARAYTHGASGTATYASGVRFTIPAYASTAFWKNGNLSFWLAEETTANSYSGVAAIGWRSTAAINQFTITAGSGHFVAGTICVAYVY